jgi:hypothetical protein
MRRNLPTALLAAATAIVAAILVLVVVVPRGANAPAASPTPTPSPTVTATATSTVAASPTATVSPSATAATGRYVSVALAYSIETPPPWRRSVCTSGSFTQDGVFYANDVFVAVTAVDETGSDTGVPYPTVRVAVEGNPRGLSPRQWAEEGRTVGSGAGQVIEDATYAGRPAAKMSYPGTPLITYFVANGPRMFVVVPSPGPTPIDAGTQQTMVRIVESFRFLSDAELAAARTASPAPLAPRSPEALADAIAAAFAAKNADAMTDLLAPCVTTAAEQAGASFVSRERYVRDLRTAFASGLVVTVRPRPFEGDRASGALTVGSTWQDTRGTRERKLMLRRGENDRWEWHGTLERLF